MTLEESKKTENKKLNDSNELPTGLIIVVIIIIGLFVIGQLHSTSPISDIPETNSQSQPQVSQNDSSSKTTPSPNTTLCNGTYYTACPRAHDFVCPADGKEAYCQSSQQQAQTQSQNTSPNVSDNLSSSLINQIEPMVVEVNCYSSDSSIVVSGSGTSVQNNGVIHIVTNYHVFAEAYLGIQLPTCYAVYPEPPNFLYNGYYGDYQLTLLGYKYNPNTYQDVAAFTLGVALPSSVVLNHVPVIQDLPQLGNLGCPEAKVGDKLTIFGYPKSGNLLGISETVTQGIISGIIAGPIYKTDAPIDHGNSGGLAILNKDNCILGIPTLGESGLTAGTGYIQSLNLAAQ